jgi:hypothetical protein
MGKLTVERCTRMGAHSLVQDNPVGVGAVGMLAWGPKKIRYLIEASDSGQPELTLKLAPWESGAGCTDIAMEATRPHYGGQRWWFRCPECRERRTTLYVRRGYWSCRVCHGLTYRSCQQAHHLERRIAWVEAIPERMRQIRERMARWERSRQLF